MTDRPDSPERPDTGEPATPEGGHRRRPRYRGTHPRRFEEKYKEHAPEKYPDAVERVLERGMTPAGQHVPILVDDVLTVLAPKPGERGVDCTLGFGGHARRLLESITPGGELLALDADPIELPKSVERLARAGFGDDVLHARRTNFAGLAAAIADLGWHDGVDFVLADLGLSSMQIDDPARGFTFKHDGPLDMRMNPKKGVSVADWLARADEEELARILEEHADEPHARRIAESLTDRRGMLQTTLELADAVRASLAGRVQHEDVDASVRRTFQALRIEINDELGVLDNLLRQLPDALRAGGRAAILTFHSGEDRRVKQAFERGAKFGVYAAISDDVVRPSPEERRSNPRSASAKLRWARKG
jgi:16S rRNA (cytosine1402-N4)-methyltransferase